MLKYQLFDSPLRKEFISEVVNNSVDALDSLEGMCDSFNQIEAAREQLFQLLSGNSNEENLIFWYHFTHFKFLAESVTKQILLAAIRRNQKGKPSLNEQMVDEQLEHMKEHLKNWEENNVGDMETVEQQARHTACRSLLALYAYLNEQNLV